MPDALPTFLNRWADAMRTELWPVPTAGIALAVVGGVGLPRLDRTLDRRYPDLASALLFSGGPGAARTVLDAVASSLITVTSLTFSLTVVTLQLASSQFSPRLLRTFTRDRFVHVTLAVFLATFTYALTVLRSVRSADEAGGTGFVPELSVTVAYLLTLISVIALVLFLAHLAQEIRVETMLRTVHQDAGGTVQAVLPEVPDPARTRRAQPPVPVGAQVLTATSSGFLVRVDEKALLRAATEAGVAVVVERSPGSSVVEGTPVGVFWPLSEASGPAGEDLARNLADCLVLGYERTAAQDIGFGLRQLTDVAVKALSPGINDPTTAVHALGHSSALLGEIAQRSPGDRILRDDEGRVAVVLRRPVLGELLDMAVSQPRRYGAPDPAVLERLAQLLREVAWSVSDPADRDAVSGQLRRLRRTAAAQDFDDVEEQRLTSWFQAVEHALDGTWSKDPDLGGA